MAASSTNSLVLTVIATAAIAAFRGVTVTGAQVGAGANSLGFSQIAGAIGDAVPVVVLGTAIAEAGAAIAAGALVELDANGRVITRAAGAIVGRMAPGSTAAALGDQVEVFLIPN